MKTLTDATSSDDDFISSCLKQYPELSWLVGDCNTTPEGNATLSGGSWGARFFPNVPESALAEFNRTVVGLLVFRWVVTNQYDRFVECQSASTKLTTDQFQHLSSFVQSVLRDEHEQEAMIVFMIINDLGKVKSVIDQLGMKEEVDHDKVLAHGLTNHPTLSPSFVRLPKKQQEWILAGLNTLFNMGQFMQAENVPASLLPLASLTSEPLNFYLLHALFDIAGAAGHVKWNGSMVMNSETYRNFMLAIDVLRNITEGCNLKEVYWSYVQQRWASISDAPMNDSLARLCCMLRISKPDITLDALKDAWGILSDMEKMILWRELDKNTDRPVDILLYYSPALLVNAFQVHGLLTALEWMTRVYQETRVAIAKKKVQVVDGICTILISDLAQSAKSTSFVADSDGQRIVLCGNKAMVEKAPDIDLAKFPLLNNLSELPGKCIVPIGIGGGSDVIQAAQVAMQLRAAGKICPCVISIRTTFMGKEKRYVLNHGGEIAPNVFRITPETTGNGRFLENLPVSDIPVFLILADLSNEALLVSQIQYVLSCLDIKVDTILSIDTGGDALDIHDTTSQDYIVMKALMQLEENYHCMACEIAVGVDSPDNAEDVLLRSGARYFNMTRRNRVRTCYEKWHIIGPSAKSFGKTPLAWLTAIYEQHLPYNGEVGIPISVVNDYNNPWNPFIHFQPCMKGMFFFELKRFFCPLN